MSPPSAARARRLIAPRLSIPCVAAAIVAGAWVTGGVISNDFRASMALTAVWFALSGAACLAIGLRSRRFRLPVLGAYALTAALVGGYLGLSTLRDRVVDERVVTAAAPPAGAPERERAERRNVQLAVGRFRSHEHETSGTAQVVRLTDGRRFLTLTSFATSSGPDLRVRLVPWRHLRRRSVGIDRPRRAQGQPRRPAVRAAPAGGTGRPDGRHLLPRVQRPFGSAPLQAA
jgi:hypothetical protein